ncbi:response regulator, partial [Candidatus Woesearchaeota archaeon]|nr:response regulator [Candidatus Woesearchaeota archaeon]
MASSLNLQRNDKMERKLLFVDDEPNAQKAITLAFAEEGINVFTADSGKIGLEILTKEKIGVAISDYHLHNGMTGIEFLSQARDYAPLLSRHIYTANRGTVLDDLTDRNEHIGEDGLLLSVLDKGTTGVQGLLNAAQAGFERYERLSSSVIVVVDDERMLLRTMTRILQAYEHAIVEKDGPFDALDYIRENAANPQRPVAVILTDTNMHGMNGTQLVQAAKEIDQRIRPVIVSGNVEANVNLYAALEARIGSFPVIRKPFLPTSVLRTA